MARRKKRSKKNQDSEVMLRRLMSAAFKQSPKANTQTERVHAALPMRTSQGTPIGPVMCYLMNATKLTSAQIQAVAPKAASMGVDVVNQAIDRRLMSHTSNSLDVHLLLL